MFGLGLSAAQVYDHDHAILKTYNQSCSKVVLLRSCRLPGFEEQGPSIGKRNSAGHDGKLDASLSRTRSKVFELAMCNQWTHFVTLTLSPENGNRRDLASFKHALSKWLNNLNFRKGYNIKYLLIPEPHEDGCWHMHGLFMGIPEKMLRRFSVHERLPYRVLRMLHEGRQLYDWPAYAKKFGYVTCERIRSLDACAKYVTKYISKNLGLSVSRLNEKLYLCSQGLERAKVVCRGHLAHEFIPDFCNDYVATKVFSSCDDALALFEENNISEPRPVGFLDVVSSFLGGETECRVCPQT